MPSNIRSSFRAVGIMAEVNQKTVNTIAAIFFGGLTLAFIGAFRYAGAFKFPWEPGRPTSISISRAQMGDAYPFTVDGELRCIAPNSVVFVANGTTYGVNGTAKGKGHPPVDPIWRDDANGGKVNISSVLQQGLDLCQ